MKTWKDSLPLLVGSISLIGMIGAWATLPHRVSELEKKVAVHDRSQSFIEVINERTKIMQQDLIYLRRRMDDIAVPNSKRS